MSEYFSDVSAIESYKCHWYRNRISREENAELKQCNIQNFLNFFTFFFFSLFFKIYWNKAEFLSVRISLYRDAHRHSSLLWQISIQAFAVMQYEMLSF